MFSYGDANKIDLSEHKLVQLVGSNGNGKSSIPLILEEVLFNTNSKGLKRGDVPNRNSGKTGYSASLTFSVDSDEYKLSIKRNASTLKAVLLENGVDISGHTSTGTLDTVEKLLDKSQKEFSPLVFQSGTNSLQFLTATDTNRKKFLISLLNLEEYLRLFEKFKELHKHTSDELTKVRASCSSVKDWINKFKDTNLEHMCTVDEPAQPTELVIKLKGLESSLSTIEKDNDKIQKNNHYKKLLSDISPSDVVKPIEGVKPTAEVLQEIGSISGTIKQRGEYIAKIKGLPNSCPTCLRPIDHSKLQDILSKAEEEIEELSETLKDRRSTLVELEAHNKTVKKKLDTIAEFEKYSSLVDETLTDELKSPSALSTEIRQLRSDIKKVTDSIDSTRKYNDEAIRHNSKVDTIKVQLSKFSEDLVVLEGDLAKLADRATDLEILKKAFSTNGLIAYKLENSVQELEKLTNDYLIELSDGRFQIRYSLDGDKLNVIVSDNGVDVSIDPLSSGEKARVTTATLLAIRKLMASISKNKLNVLFLDETIDTLDADGRDRLIDILLEEQDLNIFIISHGYSHPLIPKITIVKENGISRIEVNG